MEITVFRAIEEFGAIEAPLRNIRFSVDCKTLTTELIPEVVQDKPIDLRDEGDPGIRKILGGGRPIVEGSRALHLRFEYILAMAVDADTHSDLFGGLREGWNMAPRISGSRAYYPLLEIKDSAWKAKLVEEMGPENPNWRHIRMISGECSLDVLGEMPSGAWHTNPSAGRG
jgi:hypothetical protein